MSELFFNNKVAVIQAGCSDYPLQPPFDPDEEFPELTFFSRKSGKDPVNKVYRSVREALLILGLDAGNAGSERWNPLGDLIKPGERVVVKPNFALDYHRGGKTVFSMIVHASVLRPILDYVQIALKGEGEVMVADAPVTDANFDNLVKVNGIRETLEVLNGFYPVEVRLLDWRKMVVEGFEENNLFLKRRRQEYGMRRSRTVNLGRESSLYELGDLQKRFYGADFDRRVPRKHHHGEVQEYSISADILEADVVISVPKLKTHKSAGVTLNVKNMIGINTDKNYVPHYRIGEPCESGDEFPDSGERSIRLKSKLARLFLDLFLGRAGGLFAAPLNAVLALYRKGVLQEKARNPEIETADLVYGRFLGRPVRCGHWWGNDTLWRVGADLNRILIYSDKDGVLQSAPQRKYFSIVDGIVGGEGKGPMVPEPKPAGIILAGFNPLAVDRAAVGLMGFDFRKIPIVGKVSEGAQYPLFKPERIEMRSNFAGWNELPGYENSLRFKPPPNWRGHIELTEQS